MYIRTQELEWILTNYRTLQAFIQQLGIELQNVKEESTGGGDDEAYSRAVRYNYDGMPVASHRISDRTAAAVIDRLKTAMEMRKIIKEIQVDIMTVDIVIGIIDMGMRRLNVQLRTAIELKYFEKKTWKEISHEMRVDTRTLSRYHSKALEKILSICRITLVDCLKLQKLLERDTIS